METGIRSHVRTQDLRTLPAREQIEALAFIVAEARKGTKEIGFIPKQGLEAAVALGRVVVLHNNDDLVGFAVYGGRGTTLRIYQVWVRADARLIMHGRALVAYLEERAIRRGALRISLWCLEKLAATFFWRALDFKEEERRIKSIRRSRVQIKWVRPINHSPQSLFPI